MGNNMADEGVEMARDRLRVYHHRVLSILEQRWQRSKLIVAEIQNMMLCIVESTRKLKEGVVNQAQPSTTHSEALVAIEDLEVPDYHCMRRLTRTTRTLSTGRPSCWQEHLIEWIQTWEWADDDLPRQQCTTWLELMIGYEVDTKQTVTHTYSLARGPESLLMARPPIGDLVHHFRRGFLEMLRAHFTIDARRLFEGERSNTNKGNLRLQLLGITGTWALT